MEVINEISGFDDVFTTIKVLSYKNKMKPIQIIMECPPHSIRVIKYLTIKDTKRLIEIIKHQVSLTAQKFEQFVLGESPKENIILEPYPTAIGKTYQEIKTGKIVRIEEC